MRVFYYLIAAPALFLIRAVMLPFKLLFRFFKWIYRRRKERAADFDDMDGWEFEKYVADLLVRDGCVHVETTRGSGDQGVDVIGQKDGISFAVQCKCYTGKVPNRAVQEAYAGACFYGCEVPVVLTNSYFSASAAELADETGVTLADRDDLLRLVRRTRRKR